MISRFPSKRGLQPKPPAPAPAPRSSQLAAPDVTLTIRRNAVPAPAGDSEYSDLAERGGLGEGREAGASEGEEQKEQIYESLNTFHHELTVAKLESRGPTTTTTTTTSAPSSDNLYAKVKKLSGNSGSNNTNHTNNNLNSEFMSIYELTKVETTNETSQPEESRVDNKIILQINNCELSINQHSTIR